jgi:hypothetical protein
LAVNSKGATTVRQKQRGLGRKSAVPVSGQLGAEPLLPQVLDIGVDCTHDAIVRQKYAALLAPFGDHGAQRNLLANLAGRIQDVADLEARDLRHPHGAGQPQNQRQGVPLRVSAGCFCDAQDMPDLGGSEGCSALDLFHVCAPRR